MTTEAWDIETFGNLGSVTCVLQKPHPLPHPQYCVVKGNKLYSVIYIELLRLQIFQLKKVKDVPPYTMHKFGSLTLRIVDIYRPKAKHHPQKVMRGAAILDNYM